jgi:hypothetical protein
MQTIDSGFCRTSNAAGEAGAAQGSRGFHGSLQDRADQLVRATVLSDLGESTGHGRHGHSSIRSVAAAIRKVLSTQDVTGTDAADDVLKKIETSLHKAAQKLADRGVDAKTIDATIDKFRSQLAKALEGTIAGASGSGAMSGSGTSSGTDTPSTPAPSPAPSSPTSVSKFVAREVRKERGTIELLTAEGDRVSIRFRTKEVVTGSVTQSTASDGSTTTATKASLFSRGGVKIEVDGDLNEDELAAIGDLLGKVDDIANQFFSGDVQAAFSAAGSLGVDSDQIAAYRLNLTYSRKVTAAYGYAGARLPVSAQTPASGNSTSAGSASDSASTSANSGGSVASTDDASTTAAGDAASGNGASAGSTASDAGSGTTDGTPTGPTSSDTPPATTPPGSAQKTLMDFINDALSKLSSANGAGRLSFSTHWKLSVLVTAIESAQPAQPTTAADQAAASNTQLLTDSLQKIAAA